MSTADHFVKLKCIKMADLLISANNKLNGPSEEQRRLEKVMHAEK